MPLHGWLSHGESPQVSRLRKLNHRGHLHAPTLMLPVWSASAPPNSPTCAVTTCAVIKPQVYLVSKYTRWFSELIIASTDPPSLLLHWERPVLTEAPPSPPDPPMAQQRGRGRQSHPTPQKKATTSLRHLEESSYHADQLFMRRFLHGETHGSRPYAGLLCRDLHAGAGRGGAPMFLA